MAKQEAKQKNQPEKWLFTLQYPSMGPFLSYAKNRELRKELYLAYGSLCNNDEFSNTEVVKEIVQLKHKRGDLEYKLIRGNVDTRIKKLENGEYDAIILSKAGIDALGFNEKISQEFDVDELIPCAGQGTIAIQCRDNDKDIIDANIKALELGMDAVKDSTQTLPKLDEPSKTSEERVLIKGFEAACLGALAADLDVFIGYPISPATTMLTFMQRNLIGDGKHVGQASSEIESITSILGSGYAGKRAMTSTAGPGLCLMSEGIGLAWMAEVPLVVANVQRGGLLNTETDWYGSEWGGFSCL